MPREHPEPSNKMNTDSGPSFSKKKKRIRSLIEPIKSIFNSLTFRVVLAFCTTFVTAGFIVYHLERVANHEQFQSIWDGIWWGIVTITTNGYGDKIPVTPMGRIVAALTMCTGIVTAGVVTGNIASWLVERQNKLSRGLVNLSDKRGHLVICGWRREMPKVLEEMFRLNENLNPEDIVIIAPISQETLDAFKSDERLSKVNILRGEFYTRAMLERAGVKHAKKVLILADSSQASRSLTEIDAKTVMTAMTIDKLAPQVHVAAEVLDLKFEGYLRLAHCDEIIYSNEYARILLANSVKNAGIAHIIYDILDVQTDALITTIPIPQNLVGKMFADIVAYCRQADRYIAIGLIENTGKISEIKEEALRVAQKNPNTRAVLKNLKEVRMMGTNVPVLNPGKDYVIKNHSMAVVVQTQSTSLTKQAAHA